MADSRVQLEVGVNSRQVVSFCLTILSEKRTAKTPKPLKNKGSGIRYCNPHMGGLRPATVPGRCGKTQDVQERNQCLGTGAFSHTAQAQSLTREALAHAWVAEAHSTELQINRHSLKEKLLEVLEGLCGSQYRGRSVGSAKTATIRLNLVSLWMEPDSHS